MRNSLLVKLLGAFLLVILIGGMVIGISVWLATRSAFSLYTNRVSRTWAETLAAPLAEYFSTNGNWDGVDAFISTQLPVSASMMGNYGQGAMGHGMMGQGAGRASSQRIILTDSVGMVVYDSLNLLTGQLLPTVQLLSGVPISVANQQAGTLIVSQGAASPLTAAAETFLASVNRSIVLAALAASLIAILLGILLFRYVTAPLRSMKLAAAELAQGNLTSRIPVKTKDELGDLALAFNHMADDLQSAQIQRRRMIADVAHELRTPLTVIQANLEGMIDGVVRMDRKHLAILHEETLLLNRLISDLRLLSIAESGELVLDRQNVDLSSFLPKILDKFQPAALEKKIRMEYQQDSSLSKVMIDPDRITQVVMNLIANSMNFTPRGGLITLTAKQTGKMVTVSICDTGSGIPPEEIQHVFDRFYRVDKSRARKTGGSGLGLAIVKQLVEAHGGKVSAVSPARSDAKYPGTCIIFTLPINK